MAVHFDVLFISFQSEPMNVDTGVGYVYNSCSSLYKLTFFHRSKEI